MMRNIYIFSIITVFFCPQLFAADVAKVKGSSVLINLAGESASAGDQFYAIDSSGKRRAIIQISKVKGDKAIAKIVKGKAAAGMSLQAKTNSAGSSAVRESSEKGSSSPTSPSTSRSYWGLMVGYGQDTMSVAVNNSSGVFIGTAGLSGSGYSVKGLFDYQLFPHVWFRGLAGLESFNVSGTAMCGISNKQTCDAKINYMGFDFLGRYLFSEGNFRPWLGGGIGLMFPVTKSATALDSASISNTMVVMPMGGLDWFVTPTVYIPLSIEYGMLPKSSEVDATWIQFRVGVGLPF